MNFVIQLLASLLVPTAYAGTPCLGIESVCGGNSYAIEAFISPAGQMVVALAAGLSMLFVVVGGAMMLMSAGNEGLAGQGKNYVIYSLIGFAITLMSQAIVRFVFENTASISTSQDAPFAIMGAIVSMMLLLFNITFVVVAIAAGFRMVLGSGGSSQFETAKKSLFWAIAGAIVINVAYALIQATVNLGF